MKKLLHSITSVPKRKRDEANNLGVRASAFGYGRIRYT